MIVFLSGSGFFFVRAERCQSLLCVAREAFVFLSGQATYQYCGLRVHSISAFAALCSGCCSYSQRNCATRLRYFLLVKCLFAMLIPFIFTLAIASLFSLGVSRPIRHQRSLLSDVEDVFNVVTGSHLVSKNHRLILVFSNHSLCNFRRLILLLKVGYFELSHGSDT